MSTKKIIATSMIIAATSVLLSGCWKEPKSVDWYKKPENKTSLTSMLQDCDKSGDDSQDCKNAKQARDELKAEAFGKQLRKMY